MNAIAEHEGLDNACTEGLERAARARRDGCEPCANDIEQAVLHWSGLAAYGFTDELLSAPVVAPQRGERCACGGDAVIVYDSADRRVGWCGDSIKHARRALA